MTTLEDRQNIDTNGVALVRLTESLKCRPQTRLGNGHGLRTVGTNCLEDLSFGGEDPQCHTTLSEGAKLSQMNCAWILCQHLDAAIVFVQTGQYLLCAQRKGVF